MKTNSYFFCVLIILFSVTHIQLADAKGDLSVSQMKRVKTVRQTFGSASSQSLEQMIRDVQDSPSMEGSVQVLEAVANVYKELVREHELAEPQARARLLAKVQMNMAYFQLGGPDIERPGEGKLNIVIRRKLKKYMSKDLMGDRRLFYSLNE